MSNLLRWRERRSRRKEVEKRGEGGCGGRRLEKDVGEGGGGGVS